MKIAIVVIFILFLVIFVPILNINAQISQNPKPTYTLSQVFYGNSMVKPAILNGQRYIFLSNGWGMRQSAIQIFSADANWNATSLLTTTSGVYADFYVFTFPNLWNDTIIFSGSVHGPDSDAFIGAYNVTDNTYKISTLPNGGYITQVVYVDNLNEFVLMPVSPTYQNYTLTCWGNTVSGLLNVTRWICHGSFYDSGFNGCEKMFTYFQGSGWMIRWNVTGSAQLIKWNMNDDSYSEPFNSTEGELTSARQYISSNATTLFFSVASDTTEQYYYSNDGVNFTNFLSEAGNTLEMYGQYAEQHALIYPLTNQVVLIGNIRDVARFYSYGEYIIENYYALASTSAGILEMYDNVTSHYGEVKPIIDGDNYVLGGEGYDNGNINILEKYQVPTSNTTIQAILPNREPSTTAPASSSTDGPALQTDLPIKGNIVSPISHFITTIDIIVSLLTLTGLLEVYKVKKKQ